jgi:hypothetical protein
MSFIRQFAAPVLLTVFGTVSLLGTGLHLLPGCGHFHLPGHHCSGHDWIGQELCCDHGADVSAPAVGESHDDCAICQLLAIPQTLTPPPAMVAGGVRFEPLAEATILEPSISIWRPYGARAPPRLSASA